MGSIILLSSAFTLAQTDAAAEAFFESKVRPVLVNACLKCHGPTKASSGLRLDSRAAILEGGERGPAITPGHPDKSLLLEALRHGNPKLKMPPDKKLPDHVLADVAAWIKHGALWPKTPIAQPAATDKHWSFQPVKNPQPPPDPSGWATHPIDRFIAAPLRDQGLKPTTPADPRTLLRRATFDLIGLPPSSDDIAFFEKSAIRNPQSAIENLIDRLLASPHYGERWGRHWMDVVRYADTAGDNADYPIPEIHRYRDYIIDAFNADMPFDQFIREQLAGDLLAKQGLPEQYAQRVVATGFLALSRRYATAPYEFMHLTLEDAIDTTGAAFLGLTMRCARCHDHKFDPISREDYYGLYAIYAGAQFPFAGAEEFASMKAPRQHFVPLIPNADEKLAAYRERLKILSADIKKAEKADPKKLEALRAEERLLHRTGFPPDLPSAYAVQEGKPVKTHIHLRGDPDKPGPEAPRRVPKFIEGKPVAFPENASGRLELAQWITRPDHPLTARVIVNRVWQHHFGRGLVATANNFGLRGEPPSHPELLDHLAGEFVKHGWSIKWLHRHIMGSKTYQLASTPTPDLLAKDPDNRFLGRFPRRRLEAEALRDSLLAVSGKLDRRRPGPHPFPAITSWGWTQHNPFKDVYPSHHRSVYLMTQRIQRHPILALFDAPDANASAEKRPNSLVPLQALFFMNHPFVREQAEGFARRLMELSPEAEQRVAQAHLLAWGRPATAQEIKQGVRYARRYREELQRNGTPAERLEIETWTSFARVLLSANGFMFVD